MHAKLSRGQRRDERVMRSIFFLALVACGKPPTGEQCHAMVDRYVDMIVDDNPDFARASEEARPAIHAAKKEERQKTTAYASAVARCTSEVSRSEWDCAMNAPSPNEWEACF